MPEASAVSEEQLDRLRQIARTGVLSRFFASRKSGHPMPTADRDALRALLADHAQRVEERDTWEWAVAVKDKQINELVDHDAQRVDREKRLREELEFYADENNWIVDKQWMAPCVVDGGDRAQAALAETPDEKEARLLSENEDFRGLVEAAIQDLPTKPFSEVRKELSETPDGPGLATSAQAEAEIQKQNIKRMIDNLSPEELKQADAALRDTVATKGGKPQ